MKLQRKEDAEKMVEGGSKEGKKVQLLGAMLTLIAQD